MNLRRLRQKESLRGLVAETSIRPENLVQPVFAVNGRGIIKKIESMPQVFRYSPDKLPKEVEEIQKSGVGAVLIFGVPQERDETGRVATSGRNPTVAAIKILRKKFPQLAIIADVCLCSYTKHGHCGILKKVEHNLPVFDEKKTLGNRESGAVAALPVWIDLTREILQDWPTERFPTADQTDFAPGADGRSPPAANRLYIEDLPVEKR